MGPTPCDKKRHSANFYCSTRTLHEAYCSHDWVRSACVPSTSLGHLYEDAMVAEQKDLTAKMHQRVDEIELNEDMQDGQIDDADKNVRSTL